MHAVSLGHLDFSPVWLGLEPGEAWSFCPARNYAKQIIMKKTISAKQKRGRPATGIRPMIGFRSDAEMRGAIERWAKAQPDKPKLSDAIRRLVELGLKAKR
jgi:hypothetical protein